MGQGGMGQMGQMNQMGPMGMAPRRPVRQGTSKVVPVVVSAGLAVGVFCGLLFGVGTGKHSEAAPEKASNNAKRADDTFTPESMANPNVKIPDKNAPKAGSNAVAANAGSAAAGSAAEPAAKPIKLIVEIKPDAAAQNAKVFVDGKPIDGMTADIALDPGTTKKLVKVLVKAQGFKDIEQEVEAEGESVNLKFELSKGRSSSSNASSQSTPSSGDGIHAATPSSSGGGSTGGGSTGGGSTGGSKSTGGGKSNTSPGKTTKPAKGSGGLIDI
ncbi:MAG TPA: hypothetical protein VLM79_14120 [Kofleriaceae bacterium]|nr:hypothetical protein [Kofleriaceae bacterium]